MADSSDSKVTRKITFGYAAITYVVVLGLLGVLLAGIGLYFVRRYPTADTIIWSSPVTQKLNLGK